MPVLEPYVEGVRRGLRSSARLTLVIGSFLPAASAAQEPPLLVAGTPVQAELKGETTHTYRLSLEAGQFLSLAVEQSGRDVVLVLRAPDGTVLVERDGREGNAGVERLVWIADQTAEHRVDVRPRHPKGAAGAYQVWIEPARPSRGQDAIRVRGQRAFAEAQHLHRKGDAESLQRAREQLESALADGREAGDRQAEIEALGGLGAVHWSLGSLDTALEAFTRMLPLAEAAGDPLQASNAWNGLGAIHFKRGASATALEAFLRALDLKRGQGDAAGEAQLLNNAAVLYTILGRRRESIDCLERSLALQRAVGNPAEEARVRHNLGMTLVELGETGRAWGHLNEALTLRRETGDLRGQATTLGQLGILLQILGDLRRALDHTQEALAIWRRAGDRAGEARCRFYLGALHYDLRDDDQARTNLEEAQGLCRSLGLTSTEALAHVWLGRIHARQGRHPAALDSFAEALRLQSGSGSLMEEAPAWDESGRARLSLGQLDEATRDFARSLELYRKLEAPRGQANALAGLARAELGRGRLDEARARIEEGLGFLESTRGRIDGREKRGSFLALYRHHYELHADVLMALHRREPAAGHDAAALASAERGRARGLLDTLAEAGVEVRAGAPSALVDRRRSLRERINAAAERQARLLGGRQATEDAEPLAKELRALLAEYEDVEAEIRRQSPAHAALTQPRSVGLQQIRHELLDADSVLLEYALGRERSHLWVVTAETLASFELPPAAEVEAAARLFYDRLTARNRRVRFETAREREARVADADLRLGEAAAALGRMVLAPARSHLRRRLLVVADGALQYVPFEALILPGSAALLEGHEVVSLPSASAILAVRQAGARRPAPTGTVAVFADPVFDLADPRVRGPKAAPAGARSLDGPVEDDVAGAFRERGRASLRGETPRGLPLPRLPGTLAEAEAIAALVPPAQRRLAVGFEATRELALSDALARYRILHFATHGILDSEEPALSGLAFSMVDQRGGARDGLLRLHEIYNLRLPADLVVLSACHTALGREVRGEGLVGLTRGFMHAGARSVLASLWKVDDAATADLMARFYRAMLRGGRPPAAALREAKLALARDPRWGSPYFWGAFVLQGEWR